MGCRTLRSDAVTRKARAPLSAPSSVRQEPLSCESEDTVRPEPSKVVCVGRRPGEFSTGSSCAHPGRMGAGDLHEIVVPACRRATPPRSVTRPSPARSGVARSGRRHGRALRSLPRVFRPSRSTSPGLHLDHAGQELGDRSCPARAPADGRFRWTGQALFARTFAPCTGIDRSGPPPCCNPALPLSCAHCSFLPPDAMNHQSVTMARTAVRVGRSPIPSFPPPQRRVSAKATSTLGMRPTAGATTPRPAI